MTDTAPVRHRARTENDNPDLIWGIQSIAAALKRSERQTSYLLASGKLPFARKLGGRYCASRRAMRAYFGEPE